MKRVTWDLLVPAIEKSQSLSDLVALADEESKLAGRIVAQEGPVFTIVTRDRTVTATVSGKLAYASRAGTDVAPAVGDWVLLAGDNSWQVEVVWPRQTVFERKEAGLRTRAQVLCSNLDVAVIVTTAPPVVAVGDDPIAEQSLRDFSVRRVERFIATLDAAVRPIVVLNKADLVTDVTRVERSVEAELPGATVIALSALRGDGTDRLKKELLPGETAVLVGSSGSGKSTLIGRLTGEPILTNAVRAFDGRGMHTTTTRIMYALDNGALIVDTPGVREVQLWTTDGDDDERLNRTFPEIALRGAECRFRDCTHGVEPGCAVREAVRR
ncbi:MAG: ribosome small subunit-dependent GTPase A, partial [Spirochaetaceae bacterium]